MEQFRDSPQRNARDFETLGTPEMAKVHGRSPNRIPTRSPSKGGESFASFICTETPFITSSSWVTSMASRVTALISRHSLRGGAFLDQRTAAANDVAGAHSVSDDASEQPPDCFRISRLGDEKPQSGFGIHEDSADRLVDFANRRR
jgi:hypothetical protein